MCFSTSEKGSLRWVSVPYVYLDKVEDLYCTPVEAIEISPRGHRDLAIRPTVLVLWVPCIRPLHMLPKAYILRATLDKGKYLHCTPVEAIRICPRVRKDLAIGPIALVLWTCFMYPLLYCAVKSIYTASHPPCKVCGAVSTTSCINKSTPFGKYINTREQKALPPPRRLGQIPVDNIRAIIGEPILHTQNIQ